MRKGIYIYPIISGIFVLSLLYFGNYSNSQESKAAIDSATLSTTVLEYISFTLTAGDTVAFGDLTPGTPIKAPAASTVASVTTNAANGYTLGLHDGVAAANSSMIHTDAATYITDTTNSGTIAVPAAWGAATGVGITMWDADTNYETKWCADVCSTYDDTDNLYAAIPETATTAHTVTGVVSETDTSSWAFEIDVLNTQKTGAYSGDVTFTATAVLS